MAMIGGGYEVSSKTFGAGMKVSSEMLNETALVTKRVEITDEVLSKAFAIMEAKEPTFAIDKSVLSCFKICRGLLKKCKTNNGCVYSKQCKKLKRKEADAIVEIVPDMVTDSWQVNKIPFEGGSYVVWDGI